VTTAGLRKEDLEGLSSFTVTEIRNMISLLFSQLQKLVIMFNNVNTRQSGRGKKTQNYKKSLHLRLCGEKGSGAIIQFALGLIFPRETLSKAPDTQFKRLQPKKMRF